MTTRVVAWLGVVALSFSGCGGDATEEPAAHEEPEKGPTYHRDVAPILRDGCEGCHVSGGLAPFALSTYADAKAVSGLVADVTRQRRMPPFGAEDTPECQVTHSWKNDPRLSEGEIATLEAWHAAGAPEGSKVPDAGKPPSKTSFELPGVELDLTPKAPFTASGSSDVFRCFVFDPALTADAWINGVQVLPGNPEVVHHAVLFSDPTGASAALADDSGGYECFGGAGVPESQILDVWVPGSPPREFDANIGMPIKAGSKLVMQIHYHPAGTVAEPDETRLQLRFTDSPEYVLVTLGFGNYQAASVDDQYGVGELLPGPSDPPSGVEFRIPPGVADHTESMRLTLHAGDDGVLPDIFVYGAFNHMHYVGTDMRFGVKHVATGEDECLLHTPHWDFSWQRFYHYDAPTESLSKIGQGDVFEMSCRYDNTMNNPYVARALQEQKLSQPVEIQLGEQTLDEMCVAAVQLVVPLSAL